MKTKIVIMIGLVCVFSAGMALGFVLIPKDTLRIIEKANILNQSNSVLEGETTLEEIPIEANESRINDVEDLDISLGTEVSASNEAVTAETVLIETHALPTITLVGESRIWMETVDTYTELGAIASDDAGNPLVINIEGSVNRDCACTQTLTYTATDANGQTVSIQRIIELSHPSFPDFETYTLSTNNLFIGDTLTIQITDQQASLARLDQAWISLKGNSGDFLDIPMTAKDESTLSFSYTYSVVLPSTQYSFNGVYMSIERLNGVNVNVNWKMDVVFN